MCDFSAKIFKTAKTIATFNFNHWNLLILIQNGSTGSNNNLVVDLNHVIILEFAAVDSVTKEAI